jgi:hypothetical protein
MILQRISQAVILLMMAASYSCVNEDITEKVTKEVNADPPAQEISERSTSDIFPLSVSNGLLKTSSGQPFLIVGDSPWYLIQGPDREGAEKYLENRSQKGINSIVLCLVASELNGSEDAYGNMPFLIPGDFSTPNPSYFDHVDFILSKALEEDIEVFLYPAWLGYDTGNGHPEGWYSQVIDNGPVKMYQYGRYIGTRYKDFKNIIWVMGGDCSPAAALDEIREMVRGIEEMAGPQLFSVQNGRYNSGITEYANENWVDLNTTYADHSTAARHLLADHYRDFPFYFTEGSYENTGVSAVGIRSQMYLPVLMGSNGYIFGNNPLYAFDIGWDDPVILESQGSKDLERSARFFSSRPWSTLVPDKDHTLLTKGAGDINSGNYAAAALTKDAGTAIIYTPDSRQLTVDLTRISGTRTHAWWYQPSTGIAQYLNQFSDSPAQTFTPPSDGDWLLVLDDAAKNLKSPGTVNRLVKRFEGIRSGDWRQDLTGSDPQPV